MNKLYVNPKVEEKVFEELLKIRLAFDYRLYEKEYADAHNISVRDLEKDRELLEKLSRINVIRKSYLNLIHQYLFYLNNYYRLKKIEDEENNKSVA
jgi:hypothetical protein